MVDIREQSYPYYQGEREIRKIQQHKGKKRGIRNFEILLPLMEDVTKIQNIGSQSDKSKDFMKKKKNKTNCELQKPNPLEEFLRKTDKRNDN